MAPNDLGIKESWTAAELGVTSVIEENTISDSAVQAMKDKLDFDSNKVIDALMADYPYEMYWYDKVTGFYIGFSFSFSADNDGGEYRLSYGATTNITIVMAVSKAFAEQTTAQYGTKTYLVELDADKLSQLKVQTAVDTAKQIVAENKDKTNYEKLAAYREAICELVSYDQEAADNDEMPYGNPWQLISVFDGNPNTNVVCEGYAKAFQYLCDLSTFSDDVRCYSVTGTMSGGTGAGAHMWNIVHMDDGKNYLVDVTNCDEGTIGAGNLLFLTGYSSGSTATEYSYTCKGSNIAYVYDEDTKSLYDDAALTLSDTTYGAEKYDEYLAYGKVGPEITWTLSNDGVLTISGTGDVTDNPWIEYADNIKKAVVEEGITALLDMDLTFAGCADLTEVTLLV